MARLARPKCPDLDCKHIDLAHDEFGCTGKCGNCPCRNRTFGLDSKINMEAANSEQRVLKLPLSSQPSMDIDKLEETRKARESD